MLWGQKRNNPVAYLNNSCVFYPTVLLACMLTIDPHAYTPLVPSVFLGYILVKDV